MAKAVTRALLVLPAALVVLVAAGCGLGSAASPANRQAFEKRVGSDESKARAFVASLAGMPFGSRNDYARAHPQDVRNMALVPDPELQTQFRKLMTNRG